MEENNNHLIQESALPKTNPIPLKSSQKSIPLILLLVSICSLVSFYLGRQSILNYSDFVLGVQTEKVQSNNLLALLRSNFEQTNQETSYTINNETLQTTEEGGKDIDESEIQTNSNNQEDDSDSEQSAGLSLHPKSTPTSQVIISRPTPEPVEEMNDHNKTKSTPIPTPEPTPYYYYKPDRGHKDPDNLNPIEDKKLLENYHNNIATPSSTNTSFNYIPEKINSIINSAGIEIKNPGINEDRNNQTVNISGFVDDQLFGIIKINYPIVASFNSNNGNLTSVSLPWWRTLLGKPFWKNISQIICGDNICSTTESYQTCAVDCTPICGNGICEYGEGSDTCDLDCTISE